jgi:hypothetical protein
VPRKLLRTGAKLAHSIASKHPLFLSRSGSEVLVAPLFSGNNSVAHKSTDNTLRPGPLGILDLVGASPAVVPLPD